MKLRVISGELKGRYVLVGDDIDYRPTQERVRESTAEIVKRRIRGAAVADVCAGSGAFGFEMISRGAASVDFVDADKRKVANILNNADRLGVKERVNVRCEDANRFVEQNARNDFTRYDIIFYDPPYDSEELAGLVPKLFALLNDDGILIYERRRKHNEKKTVDIEGKKNITDARMYSDTVIEIYNRGVSGNADSIVSGNI